MVEHHRDPAHALTLEEYNKLNLDRPLTDWPAGGRSGGREPRAADVQVQVRKNRDEARLKRKRDEYARRQEK